MDSYVHSTIGLLAVINPFVCGAMMLKAEHGTDMKSNILSGIKAMMVVLIILLISALFGEYILNTFGISMDAFKIVGGVILAFIGFQMLSGSKTSDSHNNQQGGLMPLIMFAASPGTIAMVITLSLVHNAEGLPINAIIGIIAAVLITIVTIIVMQFVASDRKKPGWVAIASKFMGMIIVAMGLQFMLDGIKHFF